MPSSILRPWVHELGLREQGTLLTAYRGGDDVPKLPLSSTPRQLTAYLRWIIGVPFDEREVDSEPGCFMQSKPPFEWKHAYSSSGWGEILREEYSFGRWRNWKASELGHLPLHFYTHLMHAYEIVAYRHPDIEISNRACAIYDKMAWALHLKPENKDEMIERLDEDRIAKGEIVS